MPINLLPRGLRGKDRKEISKNKEVAKDAGLSTPVGNLKKNKESKTKGGGSGFFSALFFSKEKHIDKKVSSRDADKNLEKNKREEVASLLKDKKDILKERKSSNNVVYRPFGDVDEKFQSKTENKDKVKEVNHEAKQGEAPLGEKESSERESDIDKIKTVSPPKQDPVFIKDDKVTVTNQKKEVKKEQKKSFGKWFLGKEKIADIKNTNHRPNKTGKKISSIKVSKDQHTLTATVKNKKNIKSIVKKRKKNNNDINFVLEEYSGALKVKMLRNVSFFLIVIISLLFTAFFFQVFLDYRKSELEKKRKIFIFENQKMRSMIEDNLKYMKNAEKMNLKFEKIDALLGKHIYWSNLFKFLESNTLKTVYYTTFESGGVKQLNLKATTKSFEELSKQLEIFQRSSAIESVKIDFGSLAKDKDDVEHVKFDIMLKFKDDFFFQ
ncbi:hypothetical protein HOC90_04210 [Candidatus Falkowbacteria bacterium]|jgi:hypothetical protein|nr:hypothetical protein [Elusimicrobiaceae bacterium]MBT4433520.1 hypothetical protein [Candidatus Falkowbacteria bacterium]